MRLNIDKLDQEGISVDIEKDDIIFITQGNDTTLYDKLREVSALAGLNEIESDEVCMGFRRVYIMSAIRKASNW
jgi:hypothetical protein